MTGIKAVNDLNVAVEEGSQILVFPVSHIGTTCSGVAITLCGVAWRSKSSISLKVRCLVSGSNEGSSSEELSYTF